MLRSLYEAGGQILYWGPTCWWVPENMIQAWNDDAEAVTWYWEPDIVPWVWHDDLCHAKGLVLRAYHDAEVPIWYQRTDMILEVQHDPEVMAWQQRTNNDAEVLTSWWSPRGILRAIRGTEVYILQKDLMYANVLQWHSSSDTFWRADMMLQPWHHQETWHDTEAVPWWKGPHLMLTASYDTEVLTGCWSPGIKVRLWHDAEAYT